MYIKGGSTEFSVEFHTLGMDKSWIKESKLSNEYEDGVDLLLRFRINNDVDLNIISCPCTKSGKF